jgi:hypothetical protein
MGARTHETRRPGLQFSARSLFTVAFFIAAICLIVPNVGAQVTYSVSVTIAGLPATVSTNLYIDGSFNTTINGGQSLSFTFYVTAPGHVITVDSYVPNSVLANGTRFYLQDASWSFTTGGSHIFTYTAQYYLTVETSYSTSTGQGWYNSGQAVTASITDVNVVQNQGTREVFTGWSGDATGTSPTSAQIFMTAPKTAIADWKTQFYLTVESAPANVSGLTGSGWYDAGSGATFSAAAVLPSSDNTRLTFQHWSGDYTGQSSSGQLLMNRPQTVTANFLAQYLLKIQYSPSTVSTGYNESHAGWYDINSNVQLGPAPSTVNLSSVERLRFNGWSDNSSSSSTPSFTVVMDHPRTITLSYKTQFYVDVRSSEGSVSGSGWYDRGSTANITAAGTQGWPVSYALTGWQVDPSTGAIKKVGDSWSLLVDRPYVVQAVWSVDYLPFVELFGAGGIAAVFVAVAIILARRRRMFSRGPGAPPLPPPGTPPTIGLEPPVATQICRACGALVPKGAYCEKCGAPMEAPRGPTLDEKVYDYIVKHEGVISLSTASNELGIPVEELKQITARLKDEGRLA